MNSSLSHYNLVHKFIPMPQAMEIPGANVAVGKGEKLEDTGMADDESQKQKKGVTAEARNEGRTVHFASLMDVCHLKTSELEPKKQKNTEAEWYSEVTL